MCCFDQKIFNSKGEVIMKKSETSKREPHYVDIIKTWSTVMTWLYAYLAAVIGVVLFVTRDRDSLVLCLIVSAFGLCIIWLPGLLMVSLIDDCCERCASLKPVYMRPRSIFADGLKGLGRLRIDAVNGIALVLMGVLSGVAVIMSIVGVVLDLAGMDVAIWSGGLLSWFGALIIGARMTYDVISEKRKMRWVF